MLNIVDDSTNLEDMPVPDAVVISHDHFDHLDFPTIVAMKDWPTTFVVPLGVGAHLAYWGVPEAHIKELDWWDAVQIGELSVTCTPARHASGRALWDQDHTLWAGWAFIGKAHRVYYSGDTGGADPVRAAIDRVTANVKAGDVFGCA